MMERIIAWTSVIIFAFFCLALIIAMGFVVFAGLGSAPAFALAEGTKKVILYGLIYMSVWFGGWFSNIEANRLESEAKEKQECDDAQPTRPNQ